MQTHLVPVLRGILCLKEKNDLTHEPAVVCQNFDVSVRCHEEDEGSNGRRDELRPLGLSCQKQDGR